MIRLADAEPFAQPGQRCVTLGAVELAELAERDQAGALVALVERRDRGQ
jgi:hypothetical protein